MKRLLLLLLLAVTSERAEAIAFDCLFLDSFQGDATTAPANWKPLLLIHNCVRRSVAPAAAPNLGLADLPRHVL